MKKITFLDKVGFSLFIGMMLPNLLSAADDFQTVSKPITLLGKIIILIMGLLYLIIGLMWVWLPMITIFMIKRHYEKKFEDRQEDNSKDMLMKMLIWGAGSGFVSLLVVGFFGMIFFGADGLLSGIQAYYGGLIAKIRSFMISSMGLQ